VSPSNKICPTCNNNIAEMGHTNWCDVTKPFTQTMWDLYHSAFKEGDEIVVIDHNDFMYWGKGETRGDVGCTLHRIEGDTVDLKWEEIIFMAHDGFPVSKLRGVEGHIIVEQIDTSDTTNALRRVMTESVCPLCRKSVDAFDLKAPRSNYHWQGRTDEAHLILNHRSNEQLCSSCRKGRVNQVKIRFGDPWETGEAKGRIINPGNAGSDFWGEDHEEAMELVTPDGAIAHVFDLPIIFELEVA